MVLGRVSLGHRSPPWTDARVQTGLGGRTPAGAFRLRVRASLTHETPPRSDRKEDGKAIIIPLTSMASRNGADVDAVACPGFEAMGRL